MKKILLGLCVILGLINMIGCSSDEKYPMPTSIDQNSLSAEAKAGAIKLKWTVPADSNYYYVKVTYTLPEDGKKCMRLASVNSDTMLVDNLLHRYGDINFTLQPCNRAGEASQSCSIMAQALPALKQIKTDRNPITLSAKQLYTDDQESSEGPIANLVEGMTLISTCHGAVLRLSLTILWPTWVKRMLCPLSCSPMFVVTITIKTIPKRWIFWAAILLMERIMMRARPLCWRL